MKVFATYNRDEEIRRQSSSGGVFSILAGETLRDGGVVYGAAFDDGWNVVHRRVDSIDGLAALRGSKYVYSKLGTSVRDALADLNTGRKVLFSGTPCQAAAMRKMAGEHPNLTIVEVVCHGAPEPTYWSRYLSELCAKRGKTLSDISSINFRDKRTGWKNYSFTIQFSSGEIFSQPREENIYMRAFLNDLTIREACFRCPFKKDEGSKADITLGDLWGITQLAPEIDDDKGISLLILRTSTGRESASQLTSLKEFSFDDIAKYNPAIYSSPVKPDKFERFNREAKEKGRIIKVMKRYASVPLILKIKTCIYRLIH